MASLAKNTGVIGAAFRAGVIDESGLQPRAAGLKFDVEMNLNSPRRDGLRLCGFADLERGAGRVDGKVRFRRPFHQVDAIGSSLGDIDLPMPVERRRLGDDILVPWNLLGHVRWLGTVQ